MLELPRIRELLQPIVGEPLSDMWRALGQAFDFGVQRPATNRRGEAITRGDFSLKFIGADWRVVQEGRIILGSSDHSDDDRFYEAAEPPERPYDAEAWWLARRFLDSVKACRYVCESVQASEFADLTIHLSNDVRIESFASSGQDFDLWWFHNRRTDVSCLVGPSGH